MLAIFQAYLDIALTRRGPQHLPASLPLLWLTVAAGACLALVRAAVEGASVLQSMLLYGLITAMVASVVWLLLNAMQRRERFAQTASALFGAEFILTCLKLCVVQAFPETLAEVRPQEKIVPSVPLLLLFGLEAWSLAVMSVILRAALSIGVLQSIGIVVLIFMLFIGAASLLLPLVAATG